MQARNLLTNLSPSLARHLHEKNVQQNYVWCICKANVSDWDENIAALWVWLNSSKSDYLRTNAFITSTKCKSQGKNISNSSPYVLSYRSIYS